MGIKKLGKAKINLEEELWTIEGRHADQFVMNRRLVDTRQDVKQLKKAGKRIHRRPPSKNRLQRREAFFKAKTEYDKFFLDGLAKVYEDLLEESFHSPILLMRHRDYDHPRDWRYCLYRGVIYQLDRSDYSDAEIMRRIEEQEKN